jgi:large subunit ribosomal protein L24
MKKPTTPRRLNIKKGDTVVVLSGKYRGATGPVLAAHPSIGKVTVDGVNMITRHQKSRGNTAFGQMQQGPIVRPAPMFVDKLMLQCPRCKKGTRARNVLLPDGRRARVCRKCEQTID